MVSGRGRGGADGAGLGFGSSLIASFLVVRPHRVGSEVCRRLDAAAPAWTQTRPSGTSLAALSASVSSHSCKHRELVRLRSRRRWLRSRSGFWRCRQRRLVVLAHFGLSLSLRTVSLSGFGRGV